jgi:hypothetical protein
LPAQSFILSNRIVICNVATGFTQVAGQLVKIPFHSSDAFQAKKWRKLVRTPDYVNYPDSSPSLAFPLRIIAGLSVKRRNHLRDRLQHLRDFGGHRKHGGGDRSAPRNSVRPH